jgi:hypothetical protein
MHNVGWLRLSVAEKTYELTLIYNREDNSVFRNARALVNLLVVWSVSAIAVARVLTDKTVPTSSWTHGTRRLVLIAQALTVVTATVVVLRRLLRSVLERRRKVRRFRLDHLYYLNGDKLGVDTDKVATST